MLITCILGLSVPIRVLVIETLVPATASLDTMVLLASVPFVLIIAMTVELVGRRSTLLRRLAVPIRHLGML